jgi:hypothetical protein
MKRILLFLMILLTACSPLKYAMQAHPEKFDNKNIYVPDNYVLVYEDNFNEGITSDWFHNWDWEPFTHSSTSYHFDSNIICRDGIVKFLTTYRPRTFYCPATNDSIRIEEATSRIELTPYTCPLMPVSPSYYLAARIKQDEKDSIWNAFWMYNFNSTDDEIDIQEYWDYSGGGFTTNIHHEGKMYQEHHRMGNQGDWHIYSCQVTDTTVSFYLDGYLFRRKRISIISPLFVIMGIGIMPNPPGEMLVDWFKLYKYEK